MVFNPGGLTRGANRALPITPEYASPFKFTGKVYGGTVDVSGDLIEDSEAELRLVMDRQLGNRWDTGTRGSPVNTR